MDILPSPMFFEVYSYGEYVLTVEGKCSYCRNIFEHTYGEYVLTVEATIKDGDEYLDAVSIIRQSGGIDVLKKLNDAGITARKFNPDPIELYPEDDE